MSHAAQDTSKASRAADGSGPSVRVTYDPHGRGRKGHIIVRYGARSFSDRIDILVHGERVAFLKRIQGEWRNLDNETCERVLSEMLKIATEQAPSDHDGGHDADTGDSDQYFANESGTYWRKPTSSGMEIVRLTNFQARITREVVVDDGESQASDLEIEVALAGRVSRFTIPAREFVGLNWVIERLGPTAIVEPGPSMRDRTRAAIQVLSGDIPKHRVFCHIGWREIGSQQAFLHADGAIGAAGLVSIRLDAPLDRFSLPVPPCGLELVRATQASLRMLDVSSRMVTGPCYSAIWRAALGVPCDWALFIVGRTGVQKSELAALCQGHYGRSMDRRNLPASWMSTANYNDAIMNLAKDVLFVIDDFAPNGNADQLNRDAERVLRAQGNRTGRGRLTQTSSRMAAKPPRSLILATGEDLPRGHSLQARLFVIEMQKGCVDLQALTRAQTDAAGGLYAACMSGFIAWLAPRRGTVEPALREMTREVREHLNGLAHGRGPDQVAQLQVGVDCFLRFAMEVGALSPDDATVLRRELWDALVATARRQGDHQTAEDPAVKFLGYLDSILRTGKAHLAHLSESSDDAARDQPSPRIGWLDGRFAYLDFNAAYSHVQSLARSLGDDIDITPSTMRKRLYEAGALASIEDESASGKRRYEIRKNIWGTRPRVLHMLADLPALLEKVGQVGRGSPDRPIEPPAWPTFGMVVGHEVGQESGSHQACRAGKRGAPAHTRPAPYLHAQDGSFDV